MAGILYMYIHIHNITVQCMSTISPYSTKLNQDVSVSYLITMYFSCSDLFI